jgi:hypothetical protein
MLRGKRKRTEAKVAAKVAAEVVEVVEVVGEVAEEVVGEVAEEKEVFSPDAIKFTIAPTVQYLIGFIVNTLLSEQYKAFGKKEGSFENYNIVFPSTFGSKRRKIVTEEFQDFSEKVFWKIINIIMYGESGWKHLLSFKINTIKISEHSFYYGKRVYHMHLDNKIGIIQQNDIHQLRKIRIVFSIIPDAITKIGGMYNINTHPKYLSTVYLKNQPLCAFLKQQFFHEWMSSKYEEVGLINGNSRPLYKICDDDIYRAGPGEVGIHHSHPCEGSQEIHAEANPVPDSRILFAIDFQDIREYNKKKCISSTRIPESDILENMKIMNNIQSDGFQNRLECVIKLIDSMCDNPEYSEILDYADTYGCGRKNISKVFDIIKKFKN